MNIRLFKPLILSVLCLAAYSCGESGGEEDAPAPAITGVSTEYGGNLIVVGKPVTLNGTGFSAVASENKVMYGIGLDAKSIKVDASSSTHVQFTAPDLGKKTLSVRVSVKGKESNEVTLEYTQEQTPWSDTPTIELPGATTVTIRPGVEWTSFHGNWEGQTRNINIVRTTLNEHNHIGIYYNYQDESLKNLDKKCEYLDALVGTNGPAACCHYVRVDGVQKRAANNQDDWFASCAFTIDGDNVVDIVKVASNYEAAQLPHRNVGCAGPLLVWNGEIQSYPASWEQDDFQKTTHPRTAFGISKDGKTVVQVAVDGRYTSSNASKRAIGMPMYTLAKLMKGLGCYKALNFDGGGGTAMWIYGQGDKGIVNHPCDGGQAGWDAPQANLRATGNAIYIKSDLK